MDVACDVPCIMLCRGVKYRDWYRNFCRRGNKILPGMRLLMRVCRKGGPSSDPPGQKLKYCNI